MPKNEGPWKNTERNLNCFECDGKAVEGFVPFIHAMAFLHGMDYFMSREGETIEQSD